MPTKIPTFEQMEQSGEYDDYASMARAYAIMHVEACKKEIAKKAKLVVRTNDWQKPMIDKDSITNAYPLSNIQ